MKRPLQTHQLCTFLLAALWPFVGAHSTEVFNGVAIDFGRTFLHEKRAMQLHAVVSSQETQLIASAMERIAATVNEAHSASPQARQVWRQHTSSQTLELRNALRASGVDPHLGLAVKQIHHWKIMDERIEFDVDYYMPTRAGQAPEIYRDRYAVTRSAAGWYFSVHPTALPMGQLSCQYINALWVCPDASAP
jgi:hypothetical protein